MNEEKVKIILEAAIVSSSHPLSIDHMLRLFTEDEEVGRDLIRAALDSLQQDYQERGIELSEVASGFRIQVRSNIMQWLSRVSDERPARYSRAFLETLALVAYRQPITRGEIEDVRGVSVSSHIMKTLQEREWIKIVGHRDVPGKPAMFGTTKQFLDYFDLQKLDELPTLAELRDIDSIETELGFDSVQTDLSPDQDTDSGLQEIDEQGDEIVEVDIAELSTEHDDSKDVGTDDSVKYETDYDSSQESMPVSEDQLEPVDTEQKMPNSD